MSLTKDSESPIQPTVTNPDNLARVISTPSVADVSSQNLRRIPDRIPWVVFLILIVELGERFTYFGLSGPLQNYINNPLDPGSSLPGALGRGQATASALGNFFKFWAYGSTIIGAIVADQFLGKFKTICLACFIYIVGLTILVTTAIPASINAGTAFGGLVASMVIIGLGTGGIKANVTPMCAEQYRRDSAFVKLLKSGELVIVDPELTVERMFMWFYFAVNVGALSPLITVNVEANVSFWLAYLIPLIAIFISAVVFVSSNKLFYKTKPQGSAIVDAARIITTAIKERGFENAKPSAMQAQGKEIKYPRPDIYTDEFVEDIRTGVTACKFFVFLPLYFVSWIQIWNNLISQAGTMALHGTPNDLLQNLDPIALIIFIPLLDFVIYPCLRKYKINFRPVVRITVGFMMAAFSMVYAAVLQHFIYISPPNSIHVWVQAPAYILVAFSEAFVIVTGLEIAYTKAPKTLRSLVSSFFWVTIGIAAAICIGLTPVTKDPDIMWMYTSLAVITFVGGCAFYACFRNSLEAAPVLEEAMDRSHPARNIDEEVIETGKGEV